MSILIGADIVPTKRNLDLFKMGDVEKLVGKELLGIIQNADYKIFNLEVPLTDKEDPITKSGPNLIAPTDTINGYKSLQIDLVTLANNHILDQGKSGLSSTVRMLDKNGIAHVGAGKNLKEAVEPYIFTVNNKQVGVYACAEHEFSIATELCAGANPYDPLESFDTVKKLREHCEYVIVLYHGGKEYYQYPSPMLQRVCRKFVEKGADLVVCQHSHCIGCEEKHQNGTIVYGQGNFIFDGCEDECWQTGLLIQIDIEKGISYYPIKKQKESIRLAKDDDSERIISAFYTRSHAINQKGFVEQNYKSFAESRVDYYLQQFRGVRDANLFWRGLNHITRGKWRSGLMKLIYGTSKRMSILNCIQCEAHNELIKAALISMRKRKDI